MWHFALLSCNAWQTNHLLIRTCAAHGTHAVKERFWQRLTLFLSISGANVFYLLVITKSDMLASHVRRTPLAIWQNGQVDLEKTTHLRQGTARYSKVIVVSRGKFGLRRARIALDELSGFLHNRGTCRCPAKQPASQVF